MFSINIYLNNFIYYRHKSKIVCLSESCSLFRLFLNFSTSSYFFTIFICSRIDGNGIYIFSNKSGGVKYFLFVDPDEALDTIDSKSLDEITRLKYFGNIKLMFNLAVAILEVT